LRARPSQKLVVALIYVCGMLMNSLDSTIVNVALATLGKEFDVPAASIESLIIGYLVSLAVFIPASGWLGDRFGTRRIFLIALGIFTAASMLCGIAQSLNELVAFRVLQGAGGGLLTPVGMAMLYRTFAPRERVRVGRILMFALIIGPASGPILGGLLIEKLSWRWIFFVNVPVGVTALLIGLLFLEEHREENPGKFDYTGFVLAGAGFAGMMYALSEGPSKGWLSANVVISGVIGVIIMTVFILFELRTPEPMVQLRLLGNRLFRSTLLVSMFGTASFTGILFVVPLFLQEARGASPLESGLTTFPEAIGVVVSTQLVARIYPRIGPRRLMSGGLFGMAAVLILLCTVNLNSSDWIVRILMFAMGCCMAYIFLPNQAASLATISSEATGRASTMSSVQRQVGAAVGVAIASTVLVAIGPLTAGSPGASTPNLTAYRGAFLAAVGFAVIGALIAQKVPDEDAAGTMLRSHRADAEPVLAHAD
jgi:EmrB/QacA subfamily drug resistance transporter